MMLRTLSLLACAAIVACATTQAAAPAKNPEAIKIYEATLVQRNNARAQWEGAKPEERKFCETKAGDCKMQVTDQRDELISTHQLPICQAQPDSDHEADCIAAELHKQGNPEAATKYYKSDLWCLEELSRCVAKFQESQADEARTNRIAQRRKAIESSPQGLTWHARVAATAEKIKYIRATLPPDADGDCQHVSESNDCEKSIQQHDSELAAELVKPDPEYDKKKAGKIYEQLTKVEASCSEPELKCLSKIVAKYGETNESRRWLQRNFDLLDKRQNLIEKAGDGSAAPCIETGVASHQADIVQSYRAYVKEPVLFFRTQLHRSFFAMHKSQIDCLGGVSNNGTGNGKG